MSREVLLIALAAALLVGAAIWLLPSGSPDESTASVEPQATAALAQDASAFHESFFRDWVSRHPEWSGQLRLFGDRPDPLGDQLDDLSVEARATEFDFLRRGLAQLRALDRDTQTRQERLTTDIMAWHLDDRLREEAYVLYDYPVNQLFGVQNDLIQLMTDIHALNYPEDARHYVARLSKVDEKFEQLIQSLERRKAIGNILPRTLLEKVIAGVRGFVDQPPEANPLAETYAARLAELEGLETSERNALQTAVLREVEATVYPAYRDLLAYLESELLPAAPGDGAVGIWRLPEGEAYYAQRLRHHTTTDLTPEAVHQLGLSEVERIQAEMQPLFAEIGIQGGQPFAQQMRAYWQRTFGDAELRYPSTDAGRHQALADYAALIQEANDNLGAVFDAVPEAKIRVKAVPPNQEATSPGAYYIPPSLDGSRPGTFYVNLAHLPIKPKMPTLAYHEGIPGHHFQLALQQEQDTLSTFQKVSTFTAHAEGWALYAEKLAREQGFYKTVHSRIENLWSELFRAGRLVVDTGIHYKRWSRGEALDFYSRALGTPIPGEIDRYIAWPGQAASYKVGELKILALRDRARSALGERFDIRAFHNVILNGGGMPLSILERVVDDYIRANR